VLRLSRTAIRLLSELMNPSNSRDFNLSAPNRNTTASTTPRSSEATTRCSTTIGFQAGLEPMSHRRECSLSTSNDDLRLYSFNVSMMGLIVIKGWWVEDVRAFCPCEYGFVGVKSSGSWILAAALIG
jgi:hypothetical protein